MPFRRDTNSEVKRPAGSFFFFFFSSCHVLQSRLKHELGKVPKLQKFWNLIKKKLDQMDADAAEQ